MPLVKEAEVAATVKDFAVFCDYICQNKPTLTSARAELGKKVCYEINSLLIQTRVVESAKYLQPVYFAVNLFFHIAMATGLFVKEYGKNGSVYLVPGVKLANYYQLNSVSQYLFLFRAYWAVLDCATLYQDTGAMFGHFIYLRIWLEALKNCKPGEKIVAEIETAYDADNPIHRVFVCAGPMIYHLAAFGFWNTIEEATAGRFVGRRKDDPDIKALTLTHLGAAMIPACLARPYELYNRELDSNAVDCIWRNSSPRSLLDSLGLKPVTGKQKPEPFETAFVEIFPKATLQTIKIADLFQASERAVDLGGNVYLFKVKFKPKHWRSIKLSSAHTLDHLHEAIQDAFEFDDDHLYAFFMSGKPWTGQTYWSPHSDEAPYANKVTIGRLGLRRGQKFVYLFDFGDEWQFTVQVVAILQSDTPPARPVIVASEGEALKQYPDYFPDGDE